MGLTFALLLLPGLVIGLTLHEFAHAWSASLLGDDYARRQGRVSLNPFRHLSPLGTVVLFWLGFGWGKPVPVNLYNFKRPKRDYLISSIAGPAANVIVVAACMALMLLTRHTYRFGQLPAAFLDLGHSFLALVALINAILAAINLLPVPPLDGSKIWPCLIPRLKPSFRPRTTMFFIILLLVLMWTGSLSPMLNFVVGGMEQAMPTSDAQIYDRSLYDGAEAMQDARPDRADEGFTKAVEVNPYGHRAFCLRAMVRRQLARPAEALEDINRAIELEGGIADYYLHRADILDDLNRHEEARRDRDMARLLGARLPPETQPAETAPASRTRPAPPPTGSP